MRTRRHRWWVACVTMRQAGPTTSTRAWLPLLARAHPCTDNALMLSSLCGSCRAFHLIFALAAMYMAMLMTGWNTADPVSGELSNVGHDWTTVWVRVRYYQVISRPVHCAGCLTNVMGVARS